MKKYIVLLLGVLLLAAAFTSCTQSNTAEPDAAASDTSAKPGTIKSTIPESTVISVNTESTEPDDKFSVVSTIFTPYDFVREIAGDHVELTMLLPPGIESHSYEPTPQDIILIQNCDVFIHIGGESDVWVSRVLESMDTSDKKIITLMECVDTVPEEIVEGMEDDEHEHDHDDHDLNDEHTQDDEHDLDETHGHDHEDDTSATGDMQDRELDEHVWTSPRNAKRIVERIADTLCGIDSVNAIMYKRNADAYLSLLDELDAKFQEIVDSGTRKTLVFGDRFPFRYFADAYKLEYFAAFPGCSTETEASAATVAFLIDKIKSENIPVVFHAELSNQKMANTISEETGARVLLFHACHNVTKDEMTQNASYLELMNQNAENLKEALQ